MKEKLITRSFIELSEILKACNLLESDLGLCLDHEKKEIWRELKSRRNNRFHDLHKKGLI